MAKFRMVFYWFSNLSHGLVHNLQGQAVGGARDQGAQQFREEGPAAVEPQGYLVRSSDREYSGMIQNDP